MAEYFATSCNSRHFIVTQGAAEIGKLDYERWYSLASKITLRGVQPFEIVPKGFWGTTIEVKSGPAVLLNFRMNWNGNIIIRTMFGGVEGDFIFKHKGLLKSSYVLLSHDAEELLAMQPDFKWNTMSYNYKITTTAGFNQLDNYDLLLVTAVHCANYYVSAMSGAVT